MIKFIWNLKKITLFLVLIFNNFIEISYQKTKNKMQENSIDL